MTINNKQYLNCPECPKCKPKDTLRNGVKWGICGMGGNIVYLEPWKEKRRSGSGYIHHNVSSCGLFEKKRRTGMNKLTECDDQGNWCLKGVPWKDLYVGKTITKEIQEKLYGALWKLMEYERTGLDPERVEQISESTERMEKALRDLSNGAGMRIEEFVNGVGQLGKSIEEEKNNEKHEMTVIELISLLDQEKNKRTASGTERILMLQVNGECFGYLTSAKLNGYGSGMIADVCLEVEAE